MPRIKATGPEALVNLAADAFIQFPMDNSSVIM